MIVIGDNPHDMYLAAQALGKGGGIAVDMNSAFSVTVNSNIANGCLCVCTE